METKKTPGKKPAAQQADLFSDQVELEETPKLRSSAKGPKGPNDPHDPKTMDLNEDNKDSLT